MTDFVFAILEAVVWFGLYLLFFRLWMRMFPSTIPYYAIAGMVMTWPSFLVFLFLSIILLFSMGADIGSAIFLCFSVALCQYSVWLPVRIVRNVSHVTPCSFWGVWRRALLAFLFAFMVGTAVWAGANALAFSGFSHFMEHSEFSRSRGLGPTFMVMLGHGRPVPIRKQGCLACMLEVKSIHVKDNVETNVKGRVETDKPRAGERQIEYDGAAPGFRYIGADLDDSATVRRTFAWFADDGTKEASFSLTLPRNSDRLVETDAGEDYVRPVELLVAEYPHKPFLHLWASGYPVSYWPSPETLPYARRVGKFRDGKDDLLVYSVAREEVAGKPMLHGSDFGFDGVLLYAREVPEAKGSRMRITDMVARKMLPDKAELNSALEELRKYWTSGPGSKVIGNLFMERVTSEIRRQSLLVWEDNRKGVFAHWENAEAGGFVLYMILTDKWGYKGGVNRRVHGNPGTAAAKAESPMAALVRGAKESNRELVAEALEKGANPNGSIEQNITPLGASLDGLVTPNVEILRLLLEAGADPNRLWGNSGTTPFYSIVQSSCWGRKTQEELAAYSEGIRLMLKHGADPNRKQGRFGHSPLSYAVMRGADLSIVKILIEEGGGVVTDNLIESAKDNSELLDYLRSKKNLP